MRRRRFSEAQIVGILKEHQAHAESVVRSAESRHLVEPCHGHGPCLREAFSMELDAFDLVKRVGREITFTTT